MSQHEAAREQARWEALIDREAIGEALDTDERSFIDTYEAAHPKLALERAVFDAAIASLREQLDEDRDDELTCAREATAALERYRSERDDRPQAPATSPEPPSRKLWRIAGGLAAAAGLATAAGLAAWFGLRHTNDQDAPKLGAGETIEHGPPAPSPEQPRPQPVDPRPAPAAPVDPIGRLSMVAGPGAEAPGGIELGLPVAPGDRVTQVLDSETNIDRACVSWTAPTAVVCFEGELLASPSPELGERRLRLRSGRLVAALEPLGPGQRFTVETMVGTVSAVGTVFAVEIYEGRAWVTVLEGRVELRDPTVRMLAAGQRTSLRGEVPGDEPTPLEADATPSALAQLVGLAELLRASPGDAQLSIPALGEHSLRVDGHLLDGPARLAIAPGEHALDLVDPLDAVVLDERVEVEASTPIDLARVLAPALDSGDSKPGARKTPSAKQLAEAAQRNRMARDYEETARLYRELLERYPDSPEAANVPVRLGDLLASTGDHQGALAAYELYLDRGAKQLAPEAEYGRIQALRALGRKADERAAIEAFVHARPDDYRSIELEARLAELE